MKIFITSVVMLAAAFVAFSQVIRNVRRKNSGGKRTWMSAAVMFSPVLVVLSDMLVSGTPVSMNVMAMYLMPSIMAAWLLSSFFVEENMALNVSFIVLLTDTALSVFNFLGMKGYAPPAMYDCVALAVSSVMTVFMFLFFMYGLVMRLMRVKTLMKCSSVWTIVCFTVDLVYLCIVASGMALLQLKASEAGVLLLGGAMTAIGLRIMTDSKFLIMQKKETLIVETMKLTSVVSAADASRIDEVYKELYERIVLYFEKNRPFLNSELTVNDLVRDMYSNKLYISKAISQFTGRNFCQFVNYYRVMYSMECFRENQDIRVHELASMSGFNSVVSYNMAFRLFMGENPSDWCRKEKSRLLKSRK